VFSKHAGGYPERERKVTTKASKVVGIRSNAGSNAKYEVAGLFWLQRVEGLRNEPWKREMLL
jgi:hypothetical protein